MTDTERVEIPEITQRDVSNLESAAEVARNLTITEYAALSKALDMFDALASGKLVLSRPDAPTEPLTADTLPERYAINAFDTAARWVGSCGCRDTPCKHVTAYNAARERLVGEIVALHASRPEADTVRP